MNDNQFTLKHFCIDYINHSTRFKAGISWNQLTPESGLLLLVCAKPTARPICLQAAFLLPISLTNPLSQWNHFRRLSWGLYKVDPITLYCSLWSLFRSRIRQDYFRFGRERRSHVRWLNALADLDQSPLLLPFYPGLWDSQSSLEMAKAVCHLSIWICVTTILSMDLLIWSVHSLHFTCSLV